MGRYGPARSQMPTQPHPVATLADTFMRAYGQSQDAQARQRQLDLQEEMERGRNEREGTDLLNRMFREGWRPNSGDPSTPGGSVVPDLPTIERPPTAPAEADPALPTAAPGFGSPSSWMGNAMPKPMGPPPTVDLAQTFAGNAEAPQTFATTGGMRAPDSQGMIRSVRTTAGPLRMEYREDKTPEAIQMQKITATQDAMERRQTTLADAQRQEQDRRDRAARASRVANLRALGASMADVAYGSQSEEAYRQVYDRLRPAPVRESPTERRMAGQQEQESTLTRASSELANRIQTFVENGGSLSGVNKLSLAAEIAPTYKFTPGEAAQAVRMALAQVQGSQSRDAATGLRSAQTDLTEKKVNEAAKGTDNGAKRLAALARLKVPEAEDALSNITEARRLVEGNPDAVGPVVGRTPAIIRDNLLDPGGVEARGSIIAATARIRNAISGAAVTPSEATFLQPYLPEPNDSPATLASKIPQLEREFTLMIERRRKMVDGELGPGRATPGPPAPGADPGFEAFYQNRKRAP